MVDVQFHSLLPELLIAVGFADRTAQGQHGRIRRHDVDRLTKCNRVLDQRSIVFIDAQALCLEARVLEPPEQSEPQHGRERHARFADGGAVLGSCKKPAAVVDGDGEEHEQQELRPAAGIEGEAEGEQDEGLAGAVKERLEVCMFEPSFSSTE